MYSVLGKDFCRGDPGFRHTTCALIFSGWVIHLIHVDWDTVKHYTMIHHKLDATIYMTQSGTDKSTAIRRHFYTGSLKHFDTEVMMMAIVNVQDVRRCLQKCRCLQDSTSRVSFITDAVVNILGMTRKDYIPLK